MKFCNDTLDQQRLISSTGESTFGDCFVTLRLPLSLSSYARARRLSSPDDHVFRPCLDVCLGGLGCADCKGRQLGSHLDIRHSFEFQGFLCLLHQALQSLVPQPSLLKSHYPPDSVRHTRRRRASIFGAGAVLPTAMAAHSGRGGATHAVWSKGMKRL